MKIKLCMMLLLSSVCASATEVLNSAELGNSAVMALVSSHFYDATVAIVAGDDDNAMVSIVDALENGDDRSLLWGVVIQELQERVNRGDAPSLDSYQHIISLFSDASE